MNAQKYIHTHRALSNPHSDQASLHYKPQLHAWPTLKDCLSPRLPHLYSDSSPDSPGWAAFFWPRLEVQRAATDITHSIEVEKPFSFWVCVSQILKCLKNSPFGDTCFLFSEHVFVGFQSQPSSYCRHPHVQVQISSCLP